MTDDTNVQTSIKNNFKKQQHKVSKTNLKHFTIKKHNKCLMFTLIRSNFYCEISLEGF